MVAWRPGMHCLTGIQAERGQSRVNGLRALSSPSAVDFHCASQSGALADSSAIGRTKCCQTRYPRRHARGGSRLFASRFSSLRSPSRLMP